MWLSKLNITQKMELVRLSVPKKKMKTKVTLKVKTIIHPLKVPYRKAHQKVVKNFKNEENL